MVRLGRGEFSAAARAGMGMSPELGSGLGPDGNGVHFQKKRGVDTKLQHLGQESHHARRPQPEFLAGTKMQTRPSCSCPVLWESPLLGIGSPFGPFPAPLLRGLCPPEALTHHIHCGFSPFLSPSAHGKENTTNARILCPGCIQGQSLAEPLFFMATVPPPAIPFPSGAAFTSRPLPDRVYPEQSSRGFTRAEPGFFGLGPSRCVLIRCNKSTGVQLAGEGKLLPPARNRISDHSPLQY